MPDDKMIKVILGNSFSHDFAEVSLTQLTEDDPYRFKGPGLVWQDADGHLQLKVFLTHDVDLSAALMRAFSGAQPGQLLEDSHYYRFEAIDYAGKSWQWDRVSVEEQITSSATAASGTVTAKLRRIEHIEEATGPLTGEHLWLIIPGKIRIPFNVVEDIMGQKIRSRLDLTLNDGTKVELMEREGYLIVHATHALLSLEEAAVFRVLEGIAIATGARLQWVYRCSRRGEKEYVVIASRKRNEAESRLSSPFNDFETDSFVDFVLRYCAFGKAENHQFFNYWLKVHSAWQAGIVVAALPVSVFVEGLVKSFFPELMVAPQVNQDAVTKLIKAIELVDIDQKILMRAKSALNNVASVSVLQALRRLAEQGWFNQDIPDRWYSVRNRSAHAVAFSDDSDNAKLQADVDGVFTCLGLFYVLLLVRIGFRSQFYDLSTKSFAKRRLLPLPTIESKQPA